MIACVCVCVGSCPPRTGLEPGAGRRVAETPPHMLEKAKAMTELQFKDLMDPTENFKVMLKNVGLAVAMLGDAINSRT